MARRYSKEEKCFEDRALIKNRLRQGRRIVFKARRSRPLMSAPGTLDLAAGFGRFFLFVEADWSRQ